MMCAYKYDYHVHGFLGLTLILTIIIPKYYHSFVSHWFIGFCSWVEPSEAFCDMISLERHIESCTEIPSMIKISFVMISNVSYDSPVEYKLPFYFRTKQYVASDAFSKVKDTRFLSVDISMPSIIDYVTFMTELHIPYCQGNMLIPWPRSFTCDLGYPVQGHVIYKYDYFVWIHANVFGFSTSFPSNPSVKLLSISVFILKRNLRMPAVISHPIKVFP